MNILRRTLPACLALAMITPAYAAQPGEGYVLCGAVYDATARFTKSSNSEIAADYFYTAAEKLGGKHYTEKERTVNAIGMTSIMAEKLNNPNTRAGMIEAINVCAGLIHQQPITLK